MLTAKDIVAGQKWRRRMAPEETVTVTSVGMRYGIEFAWCKEAGGDRVLLPNDYLFQHWERVDAPE